MTVKFPFSEDPDEKLLDLFELLCVTSPDSLLSLILYAMKHYKEHLVSLDTEVSSLLYPETAYQGVVDFNTEGYHKEQVRFRGTLPKARRIYDGIKAIPGNLQGLRLLPVMREARDSLIDRLKARGKTHDDELAVLATIKALRAKTLSEPVLPYFEGDPSGITRGSVTIYSDPEPFFIEDGEKLVALIDGGFPTTITFDGYDTASIMSEEGPWDLSTPNPISEVAVTSNEPFLIGAGSAAQVLHLLTWNGLVTYAFRTVYAFVTEPFYNVEAGNILIMNNGSDDLYLRVVSVTLVEQIRNVKRNIQAYVAPLGSQGDYGFPSTWPDDATWANSTYKLYESNQLSYVHTDGVGNEVTFYGELDPVNRSGISPHLFYKGQAGPIAFPRAPYYLRLEDTNRLLVETPNPLDFPAVDADKDDQPDRDFAFRTALGAFSDTYAKDASTSSSKVVDVLDNHTPRDFTPAVQGDAFSVALDSSGPGFIQVTTPNFGISNSTVWGSYTEIPADSFLTLYIDRTYVGTVNYSSAGVYTFSSEATDALEDGDVVFVPGAGYRTYDETTPGFDFPLAIPPEPGSGQLTFSLYQANDRWAITGQEITISDAEMGFVADTYLGDILTTDDDPPDFYVCVRSGTIHVYSPDGWTPPIPDPSGEDLIFQHYVVYLLRDAADLEDKDYGAILDAYQRGEKRELPDISWWENWDPDEVDFHDTAGTALLESLRDSGKTAVMTALQQGDIEEAYYLLKQKQSTNRQRFKDLIARRFSQDVPDDNIMIDSGSVIPDEPDEYPEASGDHDPDFDEVY